MDSVTSLSATYTLLATLLVASADPVVKNEPDYTTLKRRIQDAGLLEKRPAYYVLSITTNLVVWTLFLVLIFTVGAIWAQALAAVALGIVSLCVFSYRSNAARARGSVSLTLVLALTVMNCLLGLASYWNCHDAAHPVFITPLMWTAQLVKGGTSELRMNGDACPTPIPVALDVARLSSLGVIFLGVASVAVTLFRTQVSPLPTQTTLGLVGSTVTAPMDCTP